MDDAKTNLWHDLANLDELKAKGRMVVKAAGKQLALFATPDGLFACNNRCPHEGYPLSEGTLDGHCRLTCNWHNWKFDLKTGANAYGGDALRIYPVRQEAGRVFVKIEDPPQDAQRKEALRRLGEAIDDRDYDRMARELARHARAGGKAGDAIALALLHKNENFEFGFGHAQAGAADWLLLHDEAARDESEKLAALTEICDHLADDSLREPAYPFAQRVERWSQVAFLAAVEAEDEPAAQAILNGALTTGLGFADLEETLSKSALSHYADFGHSIIYVTAASRLIERLGETVEAPLLKALVRQQVMARREDLIPEFRAYAAALKRFGESKGGDIPDVSSANVPKALGLLAEAGDAKPEALFDHLLAVNADRLLRFDLELGEQVGASVADSVNWLDVTHGLTFAAAVLKTCRKFPSLWPQGLLQMACFSGRNLPFAKKSVNQADWAVAAWPAFLAEQRAALFDHGIFRPIIAVHRLKTLEAANFLIGEKPASAALIAAAIKRYLASAMKGKHALRIARQSLSFVAKEG